jgi:hypothetical protein
MRYFVLVRRLLGSALGKAELYPMSSDVDIILQCLEVNLDRSHPEA